MEISAKEVRKRFREMLDRAEHGEEVIILRRGHPVAKITPVRPARPQRLPDLTEFRNSLNVQQLRESVLEEREENRF